MVVQLDNVGLKNYIGETGIKQKTISEKSGVPETKLCFILQGKRKCEAGEYASICKALDVPMNKFLKLRLTDREVI